MFEPIYPAHAVENASIMFIFDQQVPPKPFGKIRERAANAFSSRRFLHQETPGFAIDGSTGRVVPIPNQQLPMHVIGIDNGQTVVFEPGGITVNTTSYVRWSPFLNQAMEYVEECFSGLLDVITINGLKVEYVDRFYWTGGWEDINFRSLIKSDSIFIPEKFLDHERQWHNHSGWFTQNDQPIRRLTNINIDVVDAVRPSRPTPVPSLSIRTSLQDQVNPAILPNATPWEAPHQMATHLENMHQELKELLATLITDEVQDKIRLFGDSK